MPSVGNRHPGQERSGDGQPDILASGICARGEAALLGREPPADQRIVGGKGGCLGHAQGEPVFNPGAYTHTSLALHDAIKGAKLRLIECHISNVHTREEFRSHSFISPAAAGIAVGFGVEGYAVAIHGLHRLSAAESS
jgi:Dehydroquinase class II